MQARAHIAEEALLIGKRMFLRHQRGGAQKSRSDNPRERHGVRQTHASMLCLGHPVAKPMSPQIGRIRQWSRGMTIGDRVVPMGRIGNDKMLKVIGQIQRSHTIRAATCLGSLVSC